MAAVHVKNNGNENSARQSRVTPSRTPIESAEKTADVLAYNTGFST